LPPGAAQLISAAGNGSLDNPSEPNWKRTPVRMAIPAERLEAKGVRHLERLTAFKAHNAAKGLPSGVTNIPPPHVVERDDRQRVRLSTSRMTPDAQRRKANARQHSNPPATIKIVLEATNLPGRSSASLLDGTVLVGSSRQPFLDAARVLIAAGYDPDCWLEGWRPGATAFALRARLGIAAGLTVDETRTVFAPWKPFSLSAVAPSIRRSEEAAPTLAAAPTALLQPPLEQQSKKPSETEPRAARLASSSADERRDQIELNFDDGGSGSSRA
jgi:hypothetical protein